MLLCHWENIIMLTVAYFHRAARMAVDSIGSLKCQSAVRSIQDISGFNPSHTKFLVPRTTKATKWLERCYFESLARLDNDKWERLITSTVTGGTFKLLPLCFSQHFGFKEVILLYLCDQDKNIRQLNNRGHLKIKSFVVINSESVYSSVLTNMTARLPHEPLTVFPWLLYPQTIAHYPSSCRQ